MSAEPTDLPRLTTGAGSAEPLYFESAAHPLFAWLHRPAVQTAPGLGLVNCKPLGYEAVCAHRAMRAFAEAAAELGVPALRFDYRGTGDSADIDPAADQIVNEVAKLRYRSDSVPASVETEDTGFNLHLDAPVYGVARGQAAVLYEDDVVVGAGLVTA